MNDIDEQTNVGRVLRSRKVKTEDNKCEQEFSKNILEIGESVNSVEKEYMYNFPKGLIRIEYPGLVKNVSRATETLGGIHSIKMAVLDPRNKLELQFHPENKYNKPCVADVDSNLGLLISVNSSKSSDSEPSEDDIEYEIIGSTSTNFKFNRMCDFQYLPLVSKDESTEEVEYVYDKIFPEKLPNLRWFLSKENYEQLKFQIPTNFSRFDVPQKLYPYSDDQNSKNVGLLNPEPRHFTRKNKIATRSISKFINLQNLDAVIPDQPLPITMQLIKEKKMDDEYKLVKELFEERPVWSKVAVQHSTGLTNDKVKILLAAVAYFCPIGPWRTTWLRFGYNPLKDYNSRIYQTLDYRIREAEGMKIKVNAKRKYTHKTVLKKVENLSIGSSGSKKDYVGERCYILKPNFIPPARQMFYQYCDIWLPEIQDMMLRLPKLPASTKCDSKNGWLPVKFTDHCREIVNKSVLARVQQELIEDSLKLRRKQAEFEEREGSEENPATYGSKMLNTIQKGIYRGITVKHAEQPPEVIDTVNLTEDVGDELEQVDVDDVVSSIPERIDEDSDDEDLSQCADVELDIDVEVVDEVNEMLAGI